MSIDAIIFSNPFQVDTKSISSWYITARAQEESDMWNQQTCIATF